MVDSPELGRLTRSLPSFLLPPVLWLRNTAFGKAYTRRRWVGLRDEVKWQTRRLAECVIKQRIVLLSDNALQRLKDELAQGADNDLVRITATVACRRVGNRDSELHRLLDSMIGQATDIRRAEIVVKVDPDDDLLYFRALKRRYGGRITMRIFVTDRMGGYPDGHFFHDFLVRQANPSARVWIVLTDDCRMVHAGWDEVLLEAERRGGAFFIGGDKPLEAILPADAAPAVPSEGAPAHYMANDYPFASFPMLKAIRDAVPDPRWTCFGDEFCFDAFFSAMVSKLHFSQGADLYVQVPKIVQRGGLLVFTDVPKRSKARTEALNRFMAAAAEEQRGAVAAAIMAAKESVG